MGVNRAELLQRANDQQAEFSGRAYSQDRAAARPPFVKAPPPRPSSCPRASPLRSAPPIGRRRPQEEIPRRATRQKGRRS